MASGENTRVNQLRRFYKRIDKPLAHVLAAAIVLYVIGSFLHMLDKSRSYQVPIEDPNRLIEECAVLLSDPQAASVADRERGFDRCRVVREKWPETVKKLRPSQVVLLDDGIAICLCPITAGRGYLVYPDRRSEPVDSYGFIIRDRVVEGIFKYETHDK